MELEKHWKMLRMADAIWSLCEIWKTREDKVRRNPVGVRSLEGLGALGRLGLEGLLLFIYPN